jgi:hypothetical protein
MGFFNFLWPKRSVFSREASVDGPLAQVEGREGGWIRRRLRWKKKKKNEKRADEIFSPKVHS